MGCLLIERIVAILEKNNILILAISLFGDSEITLRSLCFITAQMKLYYATRYRAAQTIIQKYNIKLYKVPRDCNDSDVGSKLNL